MMDNLKLQRRQQEVDAGELGAVIADFLDHCDSNVAGPTAAAYRREMFPFQLWWTANAERYAHKLSKPLFDDFMQWFKTEYIHKRGGPASTYTLHKATQRIRQMLDWASMPKNVLAWVPNVNHDYMAAKFYPKQHELAAILHAPHGKERVRDVAFLAFALSTGARRTELVNAKVENLKFASPLSNLKVGDDHSGHIHLRIVKGDSEGVGKGRYSVFCSKTGLLLKTWIRCTGISKGTIFGLGYVGIQNIIRNVANNCGVADIHPHAFRSAFIDYWAFKHATAGMMGSIALKLQVGHAIDTHDFGATVSYINTSNPWRNMEIIKKFHCSPLDEIEIDWARFPVHIEVNA